MRRLGKLFLVSCIIVGILLFLGVLTMPTTSKVPATPEEKIATVHKFDEKEIEAMRKKKLEEREKRAAAIKTATKGLRLSRDEVENISFYYAPETSLRSGENYWALYLAVPDAGPPYLRFKWQYAGDDWLFIERVTLSVDGTKFDTAPVTHFSVNRDHSGGRVWEWRDEPVESGHLAFFEMLARSKHTIIRYEGDQYRKDRTMPATEKKAMRKILDAYSAIKNS